MDQPQSKTTSLPNDAPDDSALPQWAIDYVSVSLKVGVSVPLIEQRLVAKGIDAELAPKVVDAALENRILDDNLPEIRSRRWRLFNRITSGTLFLAVVSYSWYYGDSATAMKLAARLIFPLACIWFSDAMGTFAGFFRIRGRTPGIVLCIGGWLLLLAFSLMLISLRFGWFNLF